MATDPDAGTADAAPMYRVRKLRSDETWAEVRRAWEAGETAALLARRYDVGLDNLWRRRASEGWERRRGADPAEADDGHARGLQPLLAGAADLGQDQVAGVAFDLFVREVLHGLGFARPRFPA